MWKGLKGAGSVVLGFDGVVLTYALVAGPALALNTWKYRARKLRWKSRRTV